MISLHKSVTHDIFACQIDEFYSSIPLKISCAWSKPVGLLRGRSLWVKSPVITALESKPSRVKNIFICSAVAFWASSMMIKAVVQSPASHISKRRYFNDTSFQIFFDDHGVHHVVPTRHKGDVNKAKFFHTYHQEETQRLPRFYGRTSKNDPANLIFL